mgnify:CR=1 FL=1
MCEDVCVCVHSNNEFLFHYPNKHTHTKKVQKYPNAHMSIKLEMFQRRFSNPAPGVEFFVFFLFVCLFAPVLEIAHLKHQGFFFQLSYIYRVRLLCNSFEIWTTQSFIDVTQWIDTWILALLSYNFVAILQSSSISFPLTYEINSRQ